jgi:hypothetical protein
VPASPSPGPNANVSVRNSNGTDYPEHKIQIRTDYTPENAYTTDFQQKIKDLFPLISDIYGLSVYQRHLWAA